MGDLKDFFEPDCKYIDRCKSKGPLCMSCKNNKKRKEDHYEQDGKPPYIFPPDQPYQPPVVTFCSTRGFY